MLLLQVTLGCDLAWQSIRLLTEAGAIRGFHHSGLPGFVRVPLAGSETVAGLLFAFPPTSIVGSWALLVVLGLAFLIHGVHGQFEELLVVYAAAVGVVLSYRLLAASELPH